MIDKKKVKSLQGLYGAAITGRQMKIMDVCWTFYGDTPETDITDLLADIRHFCDANGLDFANLDRMAYQHYLAELGEERGVIE